MLKQKHIPVWRIIQLCRILSIARCPRKCNGFMERWVVRAADPYNARFWCVRCLPCLKGGGRAISEGGGIATHRVALSLWRQLSPSLAIRPASPRESWGPYAFRNFIITLWNSLSLFASQKSSSLLREPAGRAILVCAVPPGGSLAPCSLRAVALPCFGI